LLLPIVPTIVTAASGGLLANNINDMDKAIIIIIISYIMMGMGLLLALSIIAIYIYRIFAHRLSPLGQGTYGFIQIGSACQKVIGDNKYISNLVSFAYSMSFIIALTLWGYALWYLIFAIFSIGLSIKQKIPFNIGWWSLTFPIGVFTAATLNIGEILNSKVLLILSSIITVCLVIIWLFLIIKTCLNCRRNTTNPPNE
jgi:tellurite resistance protein TehA-like permease